jgi:hypothetical protein
MDDGCAGDYVVSNYSYIPLQSCHTVTLGPCCQNACLLQGLLVRAAKDQQVDTEKKEEAC